MKKAGIITTYFATNFGAMLQPFALKRTLEGLGLDVEMIRYKQPYIYNTYNPLYFRAFFRKNIFAAFRNIMNLPSDLKKEKVFRKYLLKHINPNPGFEKTIPRDKDFYFFGSDQIWNPKITNGFDPVYFGDFPTKKGAKRIAYAASAEAIAYTDLEVDFLKKNLSNFDFISVREQSLNNNLRKYTGIQNITTVLDPTLIANPNIYNEINHENPLPGKKFILFYKIRNCMNFAEEIYRYAQSKGAELLILSSWFERDIKRFAQIHKHVTYLPAAGVETFLGAMEMAECVFTPSFHGCVFSILNHKPFWGLSLRDSWNTRAKDLLNSLDLNERMLNDSAEIQENLIDYAKVDQKLEFLKQQSMNFIKNAIME